jgi:hypothetical protein
VEKVCVWAEAKSEAPRVSSSSVFMQDIVSSNRGVSQRRLE